MGNVMKKAIGFAVLSLFMTSNVQALDFGVGVKAGTTGVGAEVSVALTQTINARISVTSISDEFDDNFEIEDDDNNANIDATLDLDFGATALLFDWYVFDGTFHITAGMVRNDSSIELSGEITDANVVFNGQTYNVASEFEDPNLSAKIDAGDSFEPYLGIGWGRKADDDPGLALSIELGVMLFSPSVELIAPTATDSAEQDELNANVAEAESAAEDEISDALEVYPVLSIGLNYAF